MRPYIICHMLSSIDGKIDSESLKGLSAAGEYEATGAQLDGDAWICGRTTMQQHFADPEPFVARSHTAAGPTPVHVACERVRMPWRWTLSENCNGHAVTSTAIT